MQKKLVQQFSVIGEHLKGECLARTGNLSIPFGQIHRIRLQAPGMMPGGEIAGVELDEVVRTLYSHCTADHRALAAMWELTANTNLSNPSAEHGLRVVLRRTFPDVPWSQPRHADARIRMVQVLAAISWQVGGFRGTRNWPLRVKLDVGTLYLGHEGVEWPGYRRRFSKPLRFEPQEGLRETFTTTGYTHADVGGAYRYLSTVLPELSWPLTVLFGVLARFDPDQVLKKALLAGFDLYRDDDVDQQVEEKGGPVDNSPWLAAMRKVDTSDEIYVRQIADILKPVVKKTEVYEWFGKDPRQTFKLGPEAKAWLRGRLQQLEIKVKGQDAGPADGVQKLLELQELLR